MRLFCVIISFLCFVSSARTQRMKEIVVEYDTTGSINYGSEIVFKFYWLNKKGKKKEFSRYEILKQFTLTAVNATWIDHPEKPGNSATGQNPVYSNMMGLRVTNKPGAFNVTDITFSIVFIKENGPEFSLAKRVRLNYKGQLNLDFAGRNGTDGTKGDDKAAPLIFRDGKNGEDGTNGQPGEDGHLVDLKMKWVTDPATGKMWAEIIAFDQKTNETHNYRTPYPENGIYINVSGGNGGNGGNGGDGSRGKHAKSVDGKITDPGNGGNGGKGGDGGNGGIGGSVNITVHPNASDMANYVIVINNGGAAGMGGNAGAAGKPGDSIAGSGTGREGTRGTIGNSGSMGMPGLSASMNTSDF